MRYLLDIHMIELRDVELTDDDFVFGLGGKAWTFGDRNVGIDIIETALRSRVCRGDHKESRWKQRRALNSAPRKLSGPRKGALEGSS